MSMFYRRFLLERLTGSVSRNKVRLVLGARQTGKTELLRHVADPDASISFDLQNSELRRRFETDPASLGRELRGLARKIRTVFVDEVQKVPALLDEVQALYDSNRSRWQFFLTGSSARRLRSRSANLLPGRSHGYHLHPVCAWETSAGADSLEIPAPRSNPRTESDLPPPFPVQTLTRSLVFGGLPGIRAEVTVAARETLRTYAGHYLEEEIRREALVRDMGPFITFLRLAAYESGQQMNLAKLSQESGVPVSTLKSFYQVLEDTLVGHWLRPYGGRTRKRLLTTPRFYVFDVGVRNAAAELPLTASLANAQRGPLLEHWVAQELIARASYLGPGHRVSFWRTAYGVEVDFVWESPREDVPIEVKWTERPQPADARHLETFLDEYPRRARRGLLVCRCPARQQLTRRVTAIPWETL